MVVLSVGLQQTKLSVGEVRDLEPYHPAAQDVKQTLQQKDLQL